MTRHDPDHPSRSNEYSGMTRDGLAVEVLTVCETLHLHAWGLARGDHVPERRERMRACLANIARALDLLDVRDGAPSGLVEAVIAQARHIEAAARNLRRPDMPLGRAVPGDAITDWSRALETICTQMREETR